MINIASKLENGGVRDEVHTSYLGYFHKALFVKYVAYGRKKSVFGFFKAFLHELFIEKKIYYTGKEHESK